MTLLLVLPTILALLTLATHFARYGYYPLTTVLVALLPLLAIDKRWVARLMQIVLCLAAIEWLVVLGDIAKERAMDHAPVMKSVFILGGTSLFTFLAALLYQTPRLKQRYATTPKVTPSLALGLLAGSLAISQPAQAQDAAPVRTATGLVQGTINTANHVRTFRGLPFAAPPVGERRWQPPQAPAPWTGTRSATVFGARCMQAPIYDDMIFRDTLSEDCLYLNVWTPAQSAGAKLPVMVWIYGGGFQAGSASEPRQDGERLASHDVVVVSFNYRMGVFGFLAHPELTTESGHGASGNYAFMDQVAALKWVKENIRAFGGDPGNVTIFGESAGSFAVSALMASPLARGLFHKAIGESGAFFGSTLSTRSLPQAEQAGQAFVRALGVSGIAAARSIPGDSLLKISGAASRGAGAPNIDGHVLPRAVADVYAEGKQAHVALLAGWNADETRSSATLARVRPTMASFAARVREQYGARADSVLAVYPARTDDEAVEASAAYGSDQFIGFGTWRWMELHRSTSGAPVYRFLFARQVPIPPNTVVNGRPATARDIGARHASEIEYVFGALASVPHVTWETGDSALSEQMMQYWSNFARTGNPNGRGLPAWPRYDAKNGHAVMRLDLTSRAATDSLRARYQALDRAMARPR